MKDNKIRTRIRDFVIKTISVKIIIWFGTATFLLWFQLIPWWGWLVISGMCFATRTTEKLLMKYFSRNEVIIPGHSPWDIKSEEPEYKIKTALKRETIKNIIFVCIIVMLSIIIFAIGRIYTDTKKELAESQGEVQELRGEVQCFRVGLTNVSKESRRRLEINKILRNSNREFEKRVETIFGELKQKHREVDRLRRERDRDRGRIIRGYGGLGREIGELGEAIDEVEASIMD
jgi:hypothetical protein